MFLSGEEKKGYDPNRIFYFFIDYYTFKFSHIIENNSEN